MTQQAYPDVRGHSCSWAQLSVSFGIDQGATLSPRGMKSINWKDDVEVGEERGLSGGKVTARTTGQYSCEGSVEFYRSGWIETLDALSAVAPVKDGVRQISLVPFDLLMKYERADQPDVIRRVKLKGCRILGRDGQNSEGVDPTMMAVNLNPIQVVEYDSNGNEVSLL